MRSRAADGARRSFTPIAGAEWPEGPCGASVISADPLIIYTQAGTGALLGVGPLFASRYGNHPATFFVTPARTIENDTDPPAMHEQAERQRRRYDRQNYVFCCNSPREVELLGQYGEAVHLISQSIVASERTFRPLKGNPVEFDAVCNSSLLPLKRQELAAEVPSVSYITYHYPEAGPKDVVQSRLDLLLHPPPGHRLLNPMRDGLPVWMDGKAVNEAYSRAAVGLCLSPHEGPMLASLEYLLAGLPVASTPSLGGRDVFYRPEYCIVADPTPSAIRDAVAELKQRAIPRDHIRRQTLALVDQQRNVLLSLFDAVLAESGSATRFGRDWPFNRGPRLGGWRSLPTFQHELDAL